jgi:hypothetical protein
MAYGAFEILGAASGGDYGVTEKLAKLTRTHTVYAVFNDFRGGSEADYGFDRAYAVKRAKTLQDATHESHFVKKLPATLWKKVDRKPNPTKRTGISKSTYIKRPSQATQSAPSKRLVKRRKANVVGSGRFPNPSKRDSFLYVVHVADIQGNPVYDVAKFREKKLAVEYAKAYAHAHNQKMVVESKKL